VEGRGVGKECWGGWHLQRYNRDEDGGDGGPGEASVSSR